MFVRVNGQRLFFDTVGTQLAVEGDRMRARLTLLVLHGGPGFDHTGLRSAFDCLADVVQVVYLDHRGNGRSVPSDPDSWTLAQWGDDIAGFCDALGIVQPIVLGQSFGGMVAQAYAIRHPGHAGALILSSTAARMDLESSIAWFGDKFGPAVRDIAHRFWTIGDDTAFADYVRVCMPVYNATQPADGTNARARAILRPKVFRHFSLPGREIRTMDFRPDLYRVRCPVLVLAGALDPITPPHLSEEILSALQPGIGRLVCFDRCGHGPFRDDPQSVLEEIRSFIARIPAPTDP